VTNQVHVFKDRDVQRVIKAARSAGLNPAAVEVDVTTGRIKVIGGSPATDKAAEIENMTAFSSDHTAGMTG
jgi:hypothetical protein